MSSQIKNHAAESFFKQPRQFQKRSPNGFPVGPRTKERQKQNRELNKLPDSVTQHCELRLAGCLGNKFLTWAHASKSRFLLTDKDWQAAARGCLSCHQAIEAMSHKEMAKLVREAIKRRKL